MRITLDMGCCMASLANKLAGEEYGSEMYYFLFNEIISEYRFNKQEYAYVVDNYPIMLDRW